MSLPHQNRLAQFGQLLLLLRFLCYFLLLLLRQHRRCCNRCAKKWGGIFRQKNVVACVGTKYKNKNPNCFEKVKSLCTHNSRSVDANAVGCRCSSSFCYPIRHAHKCSLSFPFFHSVLHFNKSMPELTENTERNIIQFVRVGVPMTLQFFAIIFPIKTH